MARTFLTKTCSISFCALAVFVTLLIPELATASDDLQTLEMFYEGKDLAVSATRSPKPISQTAENITVITAAEIEMMGAHTLVDVLRTVTGIQVDDRGGVGTFSDFSIQGAVFYHIQVLLDGITLNSLGAGEPNISAIPVQNIERVEIVKGPGSSSWGSALGGVINIITKAPAEERKLGGTLSFSAGEQSTRDSRGELSGTIRNFGYYLYASNLTSTGFRPLTGIDKNDFFGKLRYQLPNQGSILFTLGYTRTAVGQGGEAVDFSIKDHQSYLRASAALNYPLGDRADLDLSFRWLKQPLDETLTILSSGDLFQTRTGDEWNYGGSAKLTWRPSFQTIVAGVDLDHGKFDFHTNIPIFVFVADQHFTSDRIGVFLNDTLVLGDVAVTPGIRYDLMHPVGDFVSPSLGVAWNLQEKTVLRAYAARGYSLPLVAPDATQEKVWTYQAGVETTQIPYLWLKATLFLNYISDHASSDANGDPILVKLKKQGVELEAKTTPLFNTSLSAGCTFVDSRDRDTGTTLPDIPRQIVKVGLQYDDMRTFRASLFGRFLWFNATSELNPKDGAMIWDLNLAKKVLNFKDTELELFFSGHNLFNGAHYSWDVFQNSRRWLEGGMRFNF